MTGADPVSTVTLSTVTLSTATLNTATLSTATLKAATLSTAALNTGGRGLELILLLTAAASYVACGYFMKLSDGLTRPLPSLLMVLLIVLGGGLQAVAMRHRSLTSTYVMVVGLEVVVAFFVGALLLQEGISPLKIGATLLVLVGIGALVMLEG